MRHKWTIPKFTRGWMVWMLVCSGWSIFANLHPWKEAFMVWIQYPLALLYGYMIGRIDQRKSMPRETNLDKERRKLLYEIAEKSEEIVYQQTRVKFVSRKG